MAEPRVEPAPGLGEHTREIARTVLGLDDAQITALIDAGILDDAADTSARAASPTA